MSTRAANSINEKDESACQERAAAFTLALLQAFLRTGYYMQDHPESLKSKDGLYERFKSLVADRGEIAFLVREEHGKRSISIEGLTEQPLRLFDIMSRGMAETYLPRFVQFLERKELICLSLNNAMEEDEFLRFVDIMSEPAYSDMKGTSAKDQFVDILKQRQVHHLSFLFDEDFITSRSGVPWRTRMALSRMKKDIHLLPILRNLTGTELRAVKLQILTDIIRPLTAAELVYSVLINLDLATSPLLREEDAEEALFALTQDKLLLAVGALLIRDLLASGGGFPEHITAEKKERMITSLCERLAVCREPLAAALLENLFDKGLITLEMLPESLRAKVLTVKRMATYLLEPERFLRSFDGTTDPAAYFERGRIIAGFVPLLIECGRIVEAVAIGELLKKHSEEQTDRGVRARQIRAELAISSTPAVAATLFLNASKEVRTLLGRLFLVFGHAAISHLLRILIESDDPWRSKQAAETVVALGDKGLASLLTSLQSNLLGSISLPVVLHILSEQTSATYRHESECVLISYFKDPELAIRREAMAGLCRLNPVGRFAEFSERLAETDLRIKKIAISGIGRSGDPRGFEVLRSLVEKTESICSGDDLELAAGAIEALGMLMVSCPPLCPKIRSYFAALVDRFCSVSRWQRLVGGVKAYPVSLVLALTETLGARHVQDTSGSLSKLSSHHHPDVAKRAAHLYSKQQAEKNDGEYGFARPVTTTPVSVAG